MGGAFIGPPSYGAGPCQEAPAGRRRALRQTICTQTMNIHIKTNNMHIASIVHENKRGQLA